MERRLPPLWNAMAHQVGDRSGVFVVGGYVRDWMLGASTRDIDIVVEGEASGLAESFRRRFGGDLKAFDRFGTVRLVGGRGGFRFDFARARAESYPEAAALPQVRPATLLEDLGRRDFSINAMALRLNREGSAELIDPHNGVRDLKARIVRILHSASFRDDPTRIFRAARYAGRLALSLERETARRLHEAVRQGIPRLLSRERLRQELLRILAEKDPGPAMRLLKRWGLFPVVHPRFRWVSAPGDAICRVGLIALAMGPSGEDFVRSLRLDRARAQALLLALKLVRDRRSPRGPLPPLTRRVLEAGFPGLAKGALKPLLVGGGDLKSLGLSPGRIFSRLIDKAGRAQWRGAFETRAQARRWLKAVATR